MKKSFCVICGKYRKYKNPKISYIFEKTLVLSIICTKCKNEDEKIFKEEESIEILKILDLFKNILYKKMVEENISQEFKLKNIDKTRIYFLKETEENELISNKHKKVSATLNYIKNFLILTFAITECISIFTVDSLLSLPIGITSFATGLKICAIAVGIKKYMSIIKKKKKEHDKMVLLAKSKLSSIEVLISKTLINSNISQDVFVLVNNLLKEYDDMKEGIKNLKTQTVHQRFINLVYRYSL